MRVTIGQINTTNGDFEANTAKIISGIEQAKQENSDLVVFPETCIQGYTSLDWFLDRDVQRCALGPLDKIIPATQGITAVVGTVRPSGLTTGRRLYNSAAIIRNGELLGFADKTLLPEYDVFDDPRYFQPSAERHLFTIPEHNGDPTNAAQKTTDVDAALSVQQHKLGVAVCEDFWNDKTFWRERLYTNDPADELIELGAQVLVSINASPFNKAKMGQRCAMVSHRAKAANLPIIFVNLVGGNDGIIFDGASIVADARGKIILQAPPFKEFIGTVDLDSDLADQFCLPGDDIETIHDALVLGIHDYARKNRFERVVLGLSGGIDSAVVAVLACEAIGAENVLSVMMPSPYSSKSSVDDSVELGRRLRMPVIEHPISRAYETLREELHLPAPSINSRSVASENLQSRLRGNILMTISNSENRLLLSTGNKSELALGYCTLYGDTNGGLAVIGDLLKTEVYALANYLNREREIIPQAIVGKRPSAELAPGQFDDQSLPPYDQLDRVLKLYFEQKATPQEIADHGFERQFVLDILNRVESPANEFKRRQLPPTLIISRNAIGLGRRRPVTHHYRREQLNC
ncbi:MAG: NAD+ synthase [Acidobacteria bacterium]|nr:NAD+ synthase [Acidobacteriota bacterium]MCA1627942.1 NAD+ synthase [Acidobacteriota bacterium]